MMSIDGRETWLIHNFLYHGEPEFESVDRDWAIRTILGVGAGLRIRDDHQGGLDRPPAGRRPVPGPAASSSAGDAAHCGFRTPATA